MHLRVYPLLTLRLVPAAAAADAAVGWVRSLLLR